MKKKNVIFVLAILLLAVLIAACQEKGLDEPPLPTRAPVETKADEGLTKNTPSGAASESALKDDESGWAFSIDTTDLFGASVTEEDFSQNKLTVLNVWATWCGPCVMELPELQRASEAYADQGVQIVGVLQDGISDLGVPDDKIINNALELLKNANASYTVILPDETLMKNFILHMQYFPTTFFIDSEGSVVHAVVGSKSFEDWSEEIDETLAQLS